MKEYRIEALSGSHDRAGFSCGADALDGYLREQASQDVKRRIAACFVAVSISTGEVAGYYTLAATSVRLGDFPAEIAKRLPRHPLVPAALLGRLAVARQYQGKGLGGVLLVDAIFRVARTEIGVFAMLVDAMDLAAQQFYEHYGFTLLPDAERRLYLPIGLALRRFGADRV